jgi:hypothetical protein
MPLISSYFMITIAAPAGNVAPSDGFIDNLDSHGYVIWDGTPLEEGWPSDIFAALAKSRAFIRWKALIAGLSMVVNPVDVIDVVTVGGGPSVAATGITFTVIYDRISYLTTNDEFNPGVVLLGVDAVRRFVARTLIQDIITNQVILDPTLITLTAGNIVPVSHRGETFLSVEAGPLFATLELAEAAVTVTLIANT